MPDPDRFRSRIEISQGAYRLIRPKLQGIVVQPDFYNADVFRSVSLDRETKDLLKIPAADRTPAQSGRLGRLLLEDSFPAAFVKSPRESYVPTYLGYDITFPLQMSRGDFIEQVTGWATFAINWLIGMIGILLALLVTAPIMPQTFDPNSLLLLISKPVSRVSLYLSQFAGGCAFVVVLVSYMMASLVLILLIRFGIWLPSLLWWIPAFTFVFAIYYSVSALVGVTTRSAIFSILVSSFLWLLCTVLGFVQSISELFGVDRTARLPD